MGYVWVYLSRVSLCWIFVHSGHVCCPRVPWVPACSSSHQIMWGHLFCTRAVLGTELRQDIVVQAFHIQAEMYDCVFDPPDNLVWTLWPSLTKQKKMNKCCSKPANSSVVMKLIGSVVCIPKTPKRVLKGVILLEDKCLQTAADTPLQKHLGSVMCDGLSHWRAPDRWIKKIAFHAGFSVAAQKQSQVLGLFVAPGFDIQCSAFLCLCL